MAKEKYEDYYQNELNLDNEVLFVDRISGEFREGKIAEFRNYAIGIVASSSKGKVATYWRSPKEVIKTCSEELMYQWEEVK